jgi:hypothetical protein
MNKKRDLIYKKHEPNKIQDICNYVDIRPRIIDNAQIINIKKIDDNIKGKQKQEQQVTL